MGVSVSEWAAEMEGKLFKASGMGEGSDAFLVKRIGLATHFSPVKYNCRILIRIWRVSLKVLYGSITYVVLQHHSLIWTGALSTSFDLGV